MNHHKQTLNYCDYLMPASIAKKSHRRCSSCFSLISFLALFVTLLICYVGQTALAMRSSDRGYEIHLKAGVQNPARFDYSAGLAHLAQVRSSNDEIDSAHMLIQFDQIPAQSRRMKLADSGIELLGYIPHNAFLARVSVSITNGELEKIGVRYLAPLRVEDKVSDRVLSESYAPWTAFTDHRRIYAVQLHKDVSSDDGRALIESWTDEIGDYIEPLNVYLAALDSGLIRAIAQDDAVRWICQKPPELTALNNGARTAVSADTLHLPPYNLDGSDVNVLVFDAGLVGEHPDFDERLFMGETGNVWRHATHVAGTIAGDGANSGGVLAGMAPGASIVSYAYDYCDPFCLYNSPQDIWEDYNSALIDYDVSFANNSIGANISQNGYPCEWEGDYEFTCQIVDLISAGDLGRPILGVWSAGNERADERCGTGYGTIDVPATAKNAIAVGATYSNNREITWFSSWGPVDDGRIKPDLSAPGCQSDGDHGITSTVENGGYESMCGTSMSAPVVSGVVALVYEQMRRNSGAETHPLPSTIKALLANTAFDSGNPGPDYTYGFGEVRADEAIEAVLNDDRVIESSIEHGEIKQFFFYVSPGTAKLKATLAWSDPPGEMMAAIELVNDIDIYLESPTGAFVFPWLLNPLAPELPAGRGADHINPIEQVETTGPAPGIWALYVEGLTIPENGQAFSLVANHPVMTDLALIEEEAEKGSNLILTGPCAPNPSSGSAMISYTVTGGASKVDLPVFDVAGRVVRTLTDSPATSGKHQIFWDGCAANGEPAPAGIYFYQAMLFGTDQGASGAKRLVLIR